MNQHDAIVPMLVPGADTVPAVGQGLLDDAAYSSESKWGVNTRFNMPKLFRVDKTQENLFFLRAWGLFVLGISGFFPLISRAWASSILKSCVSKHAIVAKWFKINN